jgi:hypothetical protein
MFNRTKYLLGLILLGIVDAVIPFPIIGAILIYVMLHRPVWFRNAVKEIYHDYEN